MPNRHLDLITITLISISTHLLIVGMPNWQSPLRIILGLAVILIFPGYTLTLALFNKKTDIDPIERLALSLGLSIAVVPLIGLILNYTPFGIRLVPISTSLTSFTLIMSAIAALRRENTPKDQSFELNPNNKTFITNTLITTLTIATLAGIITLANTLRPQEQFTEFYILGSNGKLENYPTQLTPGESYQLTFGITNHEGQETSYTLKVPDVLTEIPLITIKLNHEETWEQTFTLRTPIPIAEGSTKLEYNLFKNEDQEAYRSLHLFVEVNEQTP